MRYIYALTMAIAVLHFYQCQEPVNNGKSYSARVDFRFGSKFYSLCASDSRLCYAIRGTATDYLSPFKIISSDTSNPFKLDSARTFFRRIDELKHETFAVYRNGDAPRVEIYSDGKKIYDSGAWDAKFWNIFRPIMGSIPKGLIPFFWTISRSDPCCPVRILIIQSMGA